MATLMEVVNKKSSEDTRVFSGYARFGGYLMVRGGYLMVPGGYFSKGVVMSCSGQLKMKGLIKFVVVVC